MAGAAITDMVRSIQSSVSSEGMMEETTYFVNGQIVGYSSTESTSYGGAPEQQVQVQVQVQVHLAGLSFMMRTITVLVRAALMVWVVTTEA